MGAAGRACVRQTSLTQPGGNRSDSPRSRAALPNGYGVLGDGESTEMLGGGGAVVQSDGCHTWHGEIWALLNQIMLSEKGATPGCETNP